MRKRYLIAFIVITLAEKAAFGQTEVSVFANYCSQGMVNEVGPSQASVSCINGGPGSAYAYADFGVLKATTQVEVYGLQTSAVLGQAHASALFNDVLHFDPPTGEKLMRKIGAALVPGGPCVTLDFVPQEDRVPPPSP